MLLNKEIMNIITSNEIVIPSPEIDLKKYKFMWGMALLFEKYQILLDRERE